MSVILAQCELSLSDPETSVSSRTAFLTIQRQGKRMSRLINDMLDYTRLEMRPDRYPKQNIDLSALTTSLCDDMALIRQQGIQLTADIQPEINIYGNPQLLSRLVTNLISNADRHTQNGTITISLTGEPGWQTICVSDTGTGMSEEMRKNALKGYVSADKDYWRHGIGLYVCHQIITAHGGKIWLKSKEGEGTQVFFSLPEEES